MMELEFQGKLLTQPEPFWEKHILGIPQQGWNLEELVPMLQMLRELVQEVWHHHLGYRVRDCQVAHNLIIR